MAPISLEEQLIPGTLEYAIHYIVEERLDMRIFDTRYNNDDTGRKANNPKLLIKIILFGYSMGMISSRSLEKACQKHTTFTRNQNTSSRQVHIFSDHRPGSLTDAMKKKIDTPEGRRQYSKRIAIVEPVFGNIRSCKKMDRFTLRGKVKVNIQWLLYCMVHNIERIMNYGRSFALT